VATKSTHLHRNLIAWHCWEADSYEEKNGGNEWQDALVRNIIIMRDSNNCKDKQTEIIKKSRRLIFREVHFQVEKSGRHRNEDAPAIPE
jgi:hypothetical protein